MMDAVAAACPDPGLLRRLIAHGPDTEAARPVLSLPGITGLRIERTHFPGAKPVQFQIRALAEDGRSEILIGEWVGDQAESLAEAEAARLAKPRRGQSPPAGKAVVADARNGLMLRRPGFDAKLPGLRLLHDADFARDRLAALGCDPAASVALVAHRLGKRAVLRISGATGPCYARLRPITSGSGKVAYDRHLAVWRALSGRAGLSIPRPLAFDPDLGLALYDALPGEAPQFGGIEGFRATRAVMEAILTLQSLGIDAPPHTASDELAILEGWLARVAHVFPSFGRRFRTALSHLGDDMERLGPQLSLPCHRDLHEGQILLHGGRAGLLDFDTLRLGDPALDVGNLQAHLILAGLRDGRSRLAFCTAMDRCLPDVPLTRIGFWRRAALLRLAMIYAFSSEPRATLRRLAEGAA